MIPEEAVVDAIRSEHLVAAAFLVHLATRDCPSMRSGLLEDFAREQNISLQRLETISQSLLEVGLLVRMPDGIALAGHVSDALRHAAVLRGVAYAQYRQRDSNQIDITLSPPALPSRLMEILPKQGFSWTRLYDTKDSLIELASQAQQRLVIVSPFLDKEGVQWIRQLFEATARNPIERVMVVRGTDQETDALRHNSSQLASSGVKILSYAITHDPSLRTPAIETFHAKILLADADKAYIGSANMTRWSRDFSMECGVILRGPSVKPVATLVEAILGISEPQFLDT
jgi:phosphatidylserine/phosphatidylglycerophosphate/cardiolipin synthase-like enzyme